MDHPDFDPKALDQFWLSDEGQSIRKICCHEKTGEPGELPHHVVSPRFTIAAVELAFTAGRLKGREEILEGLT